MKLGGVPRDFVLGGIMNELFRNLDSLSLTVAVVCAALGWSWVIVSVHTGRKLI
jgi:hypothetical protein